MTMNTFNFTRKKFTSLTSDAQRRHIIEWLTAAYQTFATGRVTAAMISFFSHQYTQMLEWADLRLFPSPAGNHPRIWLEVISNEIHRHRTALGLACRDYDLTHTVLSQDQPDKMRKEPFDCHVALDGVRSLFNAGSVIRSCEAAGFASVILGSMPDRTHSGLQKTAMGAQNWINIENTDDLAAELIVRKKRGYTIIGVETIKDSIAFSDFSYHEQIILVVGNEEFGISRHVLSVCDQFVHIPMHGIKNSINVANAASIVAFQVAAALTLQS
jgi:23S rRNA (guanosine2251-2'-O)-methyltransferase